ncbi:hypothetical protein BB561_003444 [Smittium simulii]|uniref:Kinesin motor domain-containing protein n=1 Tax=Smittium simulii TaxID=133385 RepID=A0A2T9YLC2_9FUNG|nr:hypothetical protein BB561_003444 [Smittium simulii]
MDHSNNTSNVVVAVRCKPIVKKESSVKSKELNFFEIIDENRIALGSSHKKFYLNEKSKSPLLNDTNRFFTFDHVFFEKQPSLTDSSEQQKIYEAIGEKLLKHALNGYNVCIFAYGQTGSGKTYTMIGSEESHGIIPRMCLDIFTKLKEKSDNSKIQHLNDTSIVQECYKIQISYYQIYNEKVYDLLSLNSTLPLKIREHPSMGPYIQDLTIAIVSSIDEIMTVLNIGNKKRMTSSTKMNESSSRSHAVFTIKLIYKSFNASKNSIVETESKISLVDLAGSERVSQVGVTGKLIKEGISINKSLTALSKVTSALAAKATQKKKIFIPYRDSILTWLLKESLGGNSRTAIIATVSTLNYQDTLSTLMYAERAKQIVNCAIVNEDSNSTLIDQLKAEIVFLKKQLATLDVIKPNSYHDTIDKNADNLLQNFSDDTCNKSNLVNTIKNSELTKSEYNFDQEKIICDKIIETEKLLREYCQPWEQRLRKAKTAFHIGENNKYNQANKYFNNINFLNSEPKIQRVGFLVQVDQFPYYDNNQIYFLSPGLTLIGCTNSKDSGTTVKIINDDEVNEYSYLYCKFFNDGYSGVIVYPLCEEIVINGQKILAPLILPTNCNIIIGKTHCFKYTYKHLDKVKEYQNVRINLLKESNPSKRRDSDVLLLKTSLNDLKKHIPIKKSKSLTHLNDHFSKSEKNILSRNKIATKSTENLLLENILHNNLLKIKIEQPIILRQPQLNQGEKSPEIFSGKSTPDSYPNNRRYSILSEFVNIVKKVIEMKKEKKSFEFIKKFLINSLFIKKQNDCFLKSSKEPNSLTKQLKISEDFFKKTSRQSKNNTISFQHKFDFNFGIKIINSITQSINVLKLNDFKEKFEEIEKSYYNCLNPNFTTHMDYIELFNVNSPNIYTLVGSAHIPVITDFLLNKKDLNLTPPSKKILEYPFAINVFDDINFGITNISVFGFIKVSKADQPQVTKKSLENPFFLVEVVIVSLDGLYNQDFTDVHFELEEPENYIKAGCECFGEILFVNPVVTPTVAFYQEAAIRRNSSLIKHTTNNNYNKSESANRTNFHDNLSKDNKNPKFKLTSSAFLPQKNFRKAKKSLISKESHKPLAKVLYKVLTTESEIQHIKFNLFAKISNRYISRVKNINNLGEINSKPNKLYSTGERIHEKVWLTPKTHDLVVHFNFYEIGQSGEWYKVKVCSGKEQISTFDSYKNIIIERSSSINESLSQYSIQTQTKNENNNSENSNLRKSSIFDFRGLSSSTQRRATELDWMGLYSSKKSTSYNKAKETVSLSNKAQCFILRQGLQRRVQVLLGHNSGTELDIEILSVFFNYPKLLDSNGKCLNSKDNLAPGFNKEVKLKQISLDRINTTLNNRCYYLFTGIWDSSLHDSINLDRITPDNCNVEICVDIKVQIKGLDEILSLKSNIYIVIVDRDVYNQNFLTSIKTKTNEGNYKNNVETISISSNNTKFETSKPKNQNTQDNSNLKIVNFLNDFQDYKLLRQFSKIHACYTLTLMYNEKDVDLSQDLWRFDQSNTYLRGQELLDLNTVKITESIYLAEKYAQKKEFINLLNIYKAQIFIYYMNKGYKSLRLLPASIYYMHAEKFAKQLFLYSEQKKVKKVTIYPETISDKSVLQSCSLLVSLLPIRLKLSNLQHIFIKSHYVNTHYGFLKYPDELLTNWTNKWILVQKPYMFIYTRKDMDCLENMINIKYARVEYSKNLVIATDRKWTFAVYTETGTYLFEAESKTLMFNWIKVIDEVFFKLNTNENLIENENSSKKVGIKTLNITIIPCTNEAIRSKLGGLLPAYPLIIASKGESVRLQDSPLFLKAYGEDADDEMKYQSLAFTCIDLIEEKLAKKVEREMFLGLLQNVGALLIVIIEPTYQQKQMLKQKNKIERLFFSKTRLQLNQVIADQVDREVNYLAKIQQQFRSPFLDFYFKAVAVACDHVFFTYMLPLLFWFGFAGFARGLTLMVLFIVSATGWLKDYVSTDRPNSPPLERLSFNKSHAIEFGFPSTHSAYVFGSAIYLSTLISQYDILNQYGIHYNHISLYLAIWFFALSVLIGRIYCGMHSFIDVFGGIFVGGAISYPLAVWFYEIDSFLFLESITGPLVFFAFTFIFLYYHPLFAQKCLCYQDSFSAISVINGVTFGSYLFYRLHPSTEPSPYSIYYNFSEFGLTKTLIRIGLGIVLIALWKTVSAKVILEVLGPHNIVGMSNDIKKEIQNQMFGKRQVVYSNTNLARIPVYSGIGVFVVFVHPWILYYLGL